MKRIYIIICYFTIFSFSFCNNSSEVSLKTDELNETYKNCILSIYTPYNCYYSIAFDNIGSGIFKAYNKYGKVVDQKRDSVISSYFFKINADEDKMNVNKLFQLIKSGDTLHSNPMVDAFRFELIIDQKKYIDIYGENMQIDKLLKILLNYLSKNTDDKCGIFKLFKQTH